MKSAVEQIKEKLSILDVVGVYVELHRAGKSWKGKSPFTNEKTPSFHVSPDRGMYYCFSTSQGGDMFSFIQTMEGVDFRGALKILADKAGVELVAENPEKRSARDRAFAILEDATVYYFAEGQKSAQVQDYLKSRGVTTETSHGWRIGLAPDGWRSIREHLKRKGYKDEEMLAAGLVKSADGKDPYDVFRNRVMFPISDPSGHVIGFSGGTLSDDPRNRAFQKRRNDVRVSPCKEQHSSSRLLARCRGAVRCGDVASSWLSKYCRRFWYRIYHAAHRSPFAPLGSFCALLRLR